MRSYLIHGFLFLLTFFSSTLAGVLWVNKDPFELSNFYFGLPFSLSILAILGTHEFGHYIAARRYNVDVTLPYFIPFPPIPLADIPFLFNPFGTMGAVIRMRSPLRSKEELFDIGISGPIAGLVVTVGILIYGFSNLPSVDYLYQIHPDYLAHPPTTEGGFAFGTSIAFYAFSKAFGQSTFVPPMTEIYHYPYLCAGWFGLFVTALNLIPVGQLDGGHIMYALVGPRRQVKIAWIFFGLLLFSGILGLLPLVLPGANWGSIGWLVWAAILYFVIKLRHPVIPDDAVLSMNRRVLGWFIFILFLLIFPPVPFYD